MLRSAVPTTVAALTHSLSHCLSLCSLSLLYKSLSSSSVKTEIQNEYDCTCRLKTEIPVPVSSERSRWSCTAITIRSVRRVTRRYSVQYSSLPTRPPRPPRPTSYYLGSSDTPLAAPLAPSNEGACTVTSQCHYLYCTLEHTRPPLLYYAQKG